MIAYAQTQAQALHVTNADFQVMDAFNNREGRCGEQNGAHALAAMPDIGFSGDGLYESGIWEPHYRVLQEVPDAPCNVREDVGGGDIIDSHGFCRKLAEEENT
jgi:hypothetical protein